MKTVAIADDHALYRNGLKNYLVAYGYIVTQEASDGRSLLLQLKEAEILPAICVIDLDMTDTGGYETARLIRNTWPEIKIIILSMSLFDEMESRCLRIGVHRYLLKTHAAAELKKTLLFLGKNTIVLKRTHSNYFNKP